MGLLHGLPTPVVPFRPVRDTIVDLDDETSPMPVLTRSLAEATAGDSGVVACVKDDDDTTARVPEHIRRAAVEHAESLSREKTQPLKRSSGPSLDELISERSARPIESGPESGVIERTEVIAVEPPARPVTPNEPIVIPGLEKRPSRWPTVALSVVTILSLSFAGYKSIDRDVPIAASPRAAVAVAAHTCPVEMSLRSADPEPAPKAERVAAAPARRPPRLVRQSSGAPVAVRGQHRAGIIRSMPF
jgi:hypothetical protein